MLPLKKKQLGCGGPVAVMPVQCNVLWKNICMFIAIAWFYVDLV
jgi:hypothetical protein